MQLNTGYHLPAFDLMRFFACFSVVVYHFSYSCQDQGRTEMFSSFLAPVSKYGFLGVDIFFVISGYFILLTAHGRDWCSFAAARFSRLYPGLATCGLFTFLISMVWIEFCWRPLHFRNLLTHLSGLSFIPGLSGHFVFLDSAYWTLLIEIKYYILVFLCLVFRIPFFTLLVGMFFSSLTGNLFPHFKYADYLTFYGFGGHSIVGGSIYLLRQDRAHRHLWLLFVGATGLALLHYLNHNDSPLHYNIVCALVFIFCLAILLPAGLGFWNYRWPFTAFLGGITYPLYLIHHQAGCVLAQRLGLKDSLAGVFFLTFFFAFFAAAIYLIVEKPSIPWLRNHILLLLNRFAPRSKGSFYAGR